MRDHAAWPEEAVSTRPIVPRAFSQPGWIVSFRLRALTDHFPEADCADITMEFLHAQS
jgi:hypothetical protein